jgi:serine/threonine protein kinase
MKDETAENDETLATQAVAPEKSNFAARQLGPIQLIRQIGKGGMGEVWLGRHELLGRNVAVKFLTRATLDEKDPAFKTFLAGARVAASFESPGLNKVYDADVEGGVPYLVLELLDGPNLAELVERRGPLDLSTARAVLEAVAGAIAELNQRDLVHRDLKPSNVVLTTEGRVVVTDFGLACARPAAGTGGVGLAGTPAYMAPEMFDGVISAKTDVYALGMTAYHLLAGRPAFHGDVDEQRRQHLEIPLDIAPLRAAGVPEGVIEVILRATTKDALFRPKSARHVLLSLRGAFDAAGIKGATPDDLAKSLRAHPGQAETAPRNDSADPSSGSSLGTISQMAARKRDLRAAATREPPAPIPLPPLWTGVAPVAQVISMPESKAGSLAAVEAALPQASKATPAVRHRAERRRIWVARLVASIAGALATIVAFKIRGWVYSRWNLWVDFGTRTDGSGKTVPYLTMTGSPLWVRLPLLVAPFFIMWATAIGVSTWLYRLLRGKPLPNDTENTRCGWCQHELRGITTPVCGECGHRIGAQGPDEDGLRPLARRGGRRITGWLTYPLAFLVVLIIVKLIASFVVLGITMAVHASLLVNHEKYLFWFVVLFLSLAMTLAFYEGFLQFDLTHSGRAWCRVCKSELKDLTEPVCPACHTRI